MRDRALPAQDRRAASPGPKAVAMSPATWICVALVGILATVASYLFLDFALIGPLLDRPTTWHRNIWLHGFRQLGKVSVPIWLLAVWSCLTNRWRPTVVTITALILAGATVCPLKALVRRSRPDEPLTVASGPSLSQGQDISWSRGISFPSGDTAVVFAAAMTLSCFLGPLWRIALFATAGVVAVLRMAALAHYPSDVLAGATIGVLCGIMAVRWTARQEQWDRFQVGRRWRLIAVLLLVFAAPFVSPWLHLESLRVFLDAYLIPLAGLSLIYWAAIRL